MIWNEMDSRLKAKPQPRLGRLNAHKNIDYDPASSSSSSSCSTPSSSISLRNLTSFRIQGDVGEMDRICFTLGLSGPDDFSIPFDAWQARKAKPLWLQDDQPEIKEEPVDAKDTDDVSIVIKSGREQEYVEHSKVLLTPIISNSQLHDTPRVSIIEDPLDKSGGEQEYADPSGRKQVEQVQISNSDRQGGGGGINGVRPPLLVPPSPLDNGQGHSPSLGNTSSSSSSRSSSTVDGIGPRLGETTPLSEPSSSSSTSNDSDHNDGGAGSDGDGDDGGGGVRSITDTHPMSIISSNLSFKRDIKSWTKGVLLGSGSFGTVYEGFSNDGFFFAVKEVSLLDQGKQAKQSIYQLEQEISLLSQFEHENIVQYLGTDKDEEKLYIFLELVTKGSLAQLYHKYRLHDSQVSAYTRQILHGLKYLHDRNVVHRDIKCANILVDEKGYVKLADFGLAKATKLNDVKSCKGTAFWMAPEVVNRRSRGYGLAADIWSLGCTVLEMLTRELPYSHLECMQALFKIGRGEPPPISNSLSAKARDFIQQCLQVKADDRPTAAQLLEHPFVNRPLSVSSGNGSPSQPKRTRS